MYVSQRRARQLCMCKSPTGYFTQFRKACSQGLLFIPAHRSQITNVSKRIMLFAKSEYANKISPSKTWTTPTHARRTTLRPDEMPKKKTSPRAYEIIRENSAKRKPPLIFSSLPTSHFILNITTMRPARQHIPCRKREAVPDATYHSGFVQSFSAYPRRLFFAYKRK